MKKALAVLMTLALLLMAIPTLAQEKVAPLTVTFDLNTTPDTTHNETYIYASTGYNEYWQPVTEEKEAVFITEDGVLSVDLPVPTREGWNFAGWQTQPVVTVNDLINGVSPVDAGPQSQCLWTGDAGGRRGH